MASAPERLRQWWGRLRPKDPYWDDFLHRPPADPRNVITSAILSAPAGSVFPHQTEVHDPAAMSGHIKELAKFFGADATGVSAPKGAGGNGASGEGEAGYPFAISCLVAAVEEVKEPAGIGGQFALQKCSVVHFNIAAYIRELGYRATVKTEDPDRYAAAAGLGTLDRDGRLVTKAHGRRVALSGVVLTDLPLVPDRPSS